MRSRDELVSKLSIVDEELNLRKVNISLVIVGSAGLVLDNVIDRRIANINFINPIESHEQLEALSAINNKYKQNGIVLSNSVRVYQEIFYGWERNMKFLIDLDQKFKRLNVSILALEFVLAVHCFDKATSTNLLDIGTSYKEIDKERFENSVMEIWSNCVAATKQKLIALLPQIEQVYVARKWNFDASLIKRLSQSFSNL